AKVVVIEKSSTLGGTLVISGGMMGAAGTVFQKAKGIQDSPQQHYDDIMKISAGTAVPEIARLWAEQAGPMLNWLAERGLAIPDAQPAVGTMYDPYPVPRHP